MVIVAEVLAVLQRVPDGAADRRHGDAAADEDQVLALPLFHRIAVAVGAAKADGVALVDVPQGLGDAARSAEAELDEVRPVGAGADVEGRLAGAERREDAELTHAEGKVPGAFLVAEANAHRFYVGRLLPHLDDFHQVGLIDVGTHGRTSARLVGPASGGTAPCLSHPTVLVSPYGPSVQVLLGEGVSAAMAFKTVSTPRLTGQLRVQLPQPVQSTSPNFSG